MRIGELYRAARESGGFAFCVTSLIYLLFMIIPAWMGNPLHLAVAVTILCLVFGVLFVLAPGVRPTFGQRGAWVYLGMMAGLMVALALLVTSDVLYMAIFWAGAIVMLADLKTARILTVICAGGAFALSLWLGNTLSALLAVAALFTGLSLSITFEKARLEARLSAVEQRNAVLAVAAERERIGRDLHDLLGHSLTVITVTAQLARRQLTADPMACAEQLDKIETMSRQALSDVRATASGMREVRVATEVASARSVLSAAGIAGYFPSAIPILSDEVSELFGYAIREGITNTVRHSEATRCWIEVHSDRVTIVDDGLGIERTRRATPQAKQDRPGSGLAGLVARAEAVGARLELDTRSGDGIPRGTSLSIVLNEPSARGCDGGRSARGEAAGYAGSDVGEYVRIRGSDVDGASVQSEEPVA
ncbi:sensor histidine kinase [Devriesea agamarum]|uniref:sensor histidine kinase n=1 Tax=Devriesea agamarum TaxID=472569 RepID=UPI001E4C6E42|nr:histidine kinase [Devriesea agamarum]